MRVPKIAQDEGVKAYLGRLPAGSTCRANFVASYVCLSNVRAMPKTVVASGESEGKSVRFDCNFGTKYGPSLFIYI
jgi:hypothetical protein